MFNHNYNDMKYYKDTFKNGKHIKNIISLKEYTNRLVKDFPMYNVTWLMNNFKAQCCYSNALFLCEADCEGVDYIEGIIVDRQSLGECDKEIMAIHHAWIYSHKYMCYIECTPNIIPDKYVYIISDVLSGINLENFTNSLWLTDQDGEETMYSRFIHEKDGLYGIIERQWLKDNVKIIDK